jgi:prepilin-type N-terminal cleavage/methylation domain-containing protein
MKVKSPKGFTLIELVIVIVIIGILSTIAVPIYRGYTRRAMASEGKALVGAIAQAEKAYLVEHNSYLTVATATGYNVTLDIDARQNKYYQTYTVTQSGTGSAGSATFTATAIGSGDAAGMNIIMTQNFGVPATLTEPAY